MEAARKVLRVLTLVSAGVAALVFPLMLFAIQGLGDMDFEAVVFVVALYLFHPVSLVLIFLVSFGKIASGRPTHVAAGFIALNALLLLAVAAMIQTGVIRGDAFVPILIAAPALLFLLNEFTGKLPTPELAGDNPSSPP